MSGTIMDTNPRPDAAPEPVPPDTASQPALPPATSSIAPPSSRREIPNGPGGLYLIARWLIYLSLGYVFFRLLNDFFHELMPRTGRGFVWNLLPQAALMLAAILPGFVMARIENRPFGAFGLPIKNAFRRNFWVGTIWGLGSLSVLMLALRATGAFEFDALSIHGRAIAKYGLYYAIFFLMVGLFEEFLARGYSQWVLTQGMNFWPAAVLLSAGFGALHGSNAGESKVGLVAVAFLGFFFCLTLRRTGDLWWAVGFHASWDWGESFFFSVPDSGAMMPGHLLNSSFHGPAWLTGGSVGPEGSLLVFGLIAGMWVVFNRLYPDARYGN
ncbi:MAG TPA: type II CAAX endopeptidase family protein [Terriglobales bacterium]|jgi:membrane protease YdiL (CAAX protease family)|nr:type II CAAX endopeptidase family protein [Terriglobales bacterium]